PKPAPPAPPAPLDVFSVDSLLHFTLEADFSALVRDRAQDAKYRPAVLKYAASGEAPVAVPVRLRTRGIFRLRPSTCGFPPLRINFRKKEVERTLFAGQDGLDLTTHCQDRRREYEQYVLQEYVIYRMFNALSERSFRVRLARVTYIDTTGKRDSLTRFGFLIEDDDGLAKRLGLKILERPGIPQDAMEPNYMALVAVFQYFVGNTDWSVAGLHNIRVMQDTSPATLIAYAVPYDFDWSGVINTRYAVPHPTLGTRTVRERVFRGTCFEDSQMDPVLALFQAKKDTLYALYRGQAGLDPDEAKQALGYFDEFYRTLANPRSARQVVRANCLR
ncbi:MAG: hypothetical protein ACREL9_04975, partial [Gemmatimonadales bacterium]